MESKIENRRDETNWSFLFQKSLIGVGGSVIKKISEAATSDLEAAFGDKVKLKLKAKVATIPKAHLKAIKSAKDFRDVFPEQE